MHCERIAGYGSVDVEGAGLRIASGDSLVSLLIVSAGIDGGGVNGVSWVDVQHGWIEWGELPIEDRWRELMPLRFGRGKRRNRLGRKGHLYRDICRAGLLYGPGQRSLRGGGVDIRGISGFIAAREVKMAVLDRTCEGNAAELAGQLIGGSGELKRHVAAGAVEVGGDEPSAR